MYTTQETIARRPRVRRDVQELILLSDGNPDRVIDIAARRLGHGGTGRPEEIEVAARRAFHLLLTQEQRS